MRAPAKLRKEHVAHAYINRTWRKDATGGFSRVPVSVFTDDKFVYRSMIDQTQSLGTWEFALVDYVVLEEGLVHVKVSNDYAKLTSAARNLVVDAVRVTKIDAFVVDNTDPGLYLKLSSFRHDMTYDTCAL